MNITFDPVKNAINIQKHGLSLADAEHIEWNTLWAMIVIQDRIMEKYA